MSMKPNPLASGVYFTPAKDMVRVSPDMFRWFLKRAKPESLAGANGMGWYQGDKLVAVECNGGCYVKP